jgi:hypothetical protein
MRFLALLALTSCATAHGETPKAEGPIVLELFTSQGCSSCPPADRLLGKLAEAGEVGSRKVIPLSFHVDYWNDLGWKDPYSLPAWTERQSQYSRALGDDRVYTPELVVGGAAGMVGSNATNVMSAIEKASRPTLLGASATWSKDSVEITTTAPAGADVLVAVFEDAKSNKVPRGENSGTTSVHRHVVRKLERVAVAGKQGTVKISLDPAWSSVGAVVFAQRADKKIVATALVPRT